MSNENQFLDELLIYALSRTYNRHTLVMCNHRYWSTVESREVLSEMELFDACHVHLIYLGNGVFGELKPRPFQSAPSCSFEHDETNFSKPRGRGGPAKPLDLSITAVSANTGSEQRAMKGEKSRTTGKKKNAFSDANNIPGTHPEPTSELLTDASDVLNTVVEETLQSTAAQMPLIVIPPEYWLIKPHEVTNNDATKGRNKSDDDRVNLKGSNSDLHEDSQESKETILSQINDKVTNMFINEAQENECVVPLKRLSDQMIKSFQPSRQSPEIDPYSSLEEVFSGDSDRESILNLPDEKHMKSDVAKYNMREWKRLTPRYSNKPLRSNRTQIDYSKLFTPNSDSDPEPKPAKPRKLHVMSEPSKDRIAAQEKIISSGKPKYKPAKPDISNPKKKRFFRKDPTSHPPRHRKKYAADPTEQELGNDMNDIYGGETEIDESAIDDTSSTRTPPNNLKGKFYTKSHGLPRKKKRVRYFTCGVCGTRKASTQDLNRHFKLKHEPLSCKTCDKAFTTPSGLAHHKYTHEPPRFPCDDCDKKFFFGYELKQHRVTHLKIRAHFCNYGNCTKGFMNNADLLKHVRTHTAKKKRCKKCEYSTTNPRLMQSHLKKHSTRDQFQCKHCLETFRYRNQLRRHLGDDKKCLNIPKRSNSPVF